MAFENLFGLIKKASLVVFSGAETKLQEAQRVTKEMSNLSGKRCLDVIGDWMETTTNSKYNKTGVDQVSTLVFSGTQENLEIVAHLFNQRYIYGMACSASEQDNRPHQWIVKMLQSNSELAKSVAKDIINEFDLQDVEIIGEAIGYQAALPT